MIAFTLVLCLAATAPQLPLSVATTDDALATMANPAGLGSGRGLDCYFLYNVRSGDPVHNTGFALNAGPLGAFWEPGSRYGFALGAGGGPMLAGVRLVRDSLTRWDLGAMVRPWRWVSVGAVWTDLNHDWGSLAAGVGLRPFTNRVTLTADFHSTKLGLEGTGFSTPVLGLEAEPVDGIVIAGKVKPSDWSFTAGLTLGLGNVGVGGVASKVGDRLQAGALVRAGSGRRRTFLPRPKRFLHLRLAGGVADEKPGFSLMGGRPARTTWQLLDVVEQARKDDAITGILLEPQGQRMGFATAQEFRAALSEFRAAGKKVIVYAPYMAMGDFYLASVADRVISHPMGDVYIPGVSLRTMLLKGALDKLGLEADYTRHGKYKSAVEALAADSLSGPNREQLDAFLDAVYEEFLDKAAAGRGKSRDEMAALVDRGFFMAREAREAGLVDTFCYRDELDSLLRKEIPGFRKVSEAVYTGREEFEYDWRGRDALAIIYASGSITGGVSRTDFLSGEVSMGSETMARAIRSARKDGRVKAIVLRIDSPGGDGFASDLIWRELELAKKDKPLVVSMGNVAASGGYYIACGAKRVFANPTTLTGSIGVFGLKVITEGLYNKLGIRRETFTRGEHADALSDGRRYTPEEDSIFQAHIDWFYRQFVEKVAEGRGLSFDEVDSVAQGRVWAGSDAVEVGLVDSLGGLLAAVEWAKQEAKLGDCDYVFYPQPKSGPGASLGRFMRARVEELLWQ